MRRWALVAGLLQACASSSGPPGATDLARPGSSGDLAGTGSDDLAGASADLAGSDAGGDLALPADLAGVDLSMADLAAPLDLAMPDLSMASDLASSDLAAAPDLSMPDLATPADLATSGDMALHCNILTQDCGGALKCVAAYDSANDKEVGHCVTAGAGTQGASCTSSAAGDTCAVGFVCLGGKCYKYCQICNQPSSPVSPCAGGTAADTATSTYCNPSGATPTYCVASEVIGSLPQEVVAGICDTSCDMKSPKSCTDPSNGNAGACYVASGGPVCIAPAGTTADGASCGAVGDCVGGDSCFSTGLLSNKCFQTCRVGGSDCTAPKTCTDLADPAIPGIGTCG